MDELEKIQHFLDEHTDEEFEKRFKTTKKSFARNMKMMINRSIRDDLNESFGCYSEPVYVASVAEKNNVPIDYVFEIMERDRKAHERLRRKLGLEDRYNPTTPSDKESE